MKIFHETPISLLEYSRTFTDGDYCLVHLLGDNPEYYKFFKESLKMGRTVILDNSVFELEEAFNPNDFADWIDALRPTEYIIPDVLDNADATIKNAYDWIINYGRLPGKTIGVIQGETIEDAISCYREISPLVDKVAVSFNCKFYEKEGVPKLQSWMIGRQQFMDQLVDRNIIDVNQPFHLLGCSLPQEFKYYKHPKFKFIDSLDTSNPIVHAINDIKYTEDGLDNKISTKLIEYLNHTEFDMELINYNVNMFRSFV